LLAFARTIAQAFSMTSERKVDSKINSITNGRWTAYMAAAAATGFAAAPAAEASIHYSGLLNQRIGGHDRAIFHFDPAGGTFVVDHFNFVYGSSSVPNGGVAGFGVYAAGSASVNGVSGACNGNPCVSKLDQHEPISAQPFVPQGGVLASEYDGSHREYYGQFLDRGYGLVGFKFNNGAGVQYGWVRLRMEGGHNHMFSVVDYAYGDPGEPVLAGQRGSNTFAPALESLGGLALGAVGLLACRRRRDG
jgi:hypothetical protein